MLTTPKSKFFSPMGIPRRNITPMLDDAKKRLATPGAYGSPGSGMGQLIKTKDQFANTDPADSGKQIDLIEKGKSQQLNYDAAQRAAAEKADNDARSQAGLNDPPMGGGGQPMGGQFYQPRRRR